MSTPATLPTPAIASFEVHFSLVRPADLATVRSEFEETLCQIMHKIAPCLTAALWLAAGTAAAQNTGSNAAATPSSAAVATSEGLASPEIQAKPPAPTLHICLANAPQGLDPARGPLGSAPDLVNRSVFDNLVSISANGATIEPGLARWWEVSKDGLTYTFRLRHGVAFHDTPIFEPTRPLAPEDIVFTFNRLLDPAHSGAPAGAESKLSGGTVISGLIERIEKHSDNEVRFTLREPRSGFLTMLAMDFAGIQSAEYGNKAALAGQSWLLDTHPVGTGPFRVSGLGSNTSGVSSNGPRRKPEFEVIESETGKIIRAFASIPPLAEADTRSQLKRISLTAHPGHWKGAPASPKVQIDVEADIAERFGLLAEGKCHIMPDPAKADLANLTDNPDTKVIDVDSTDTLYLAFNVENAPLDDKWVRRALAEAIDFDSLADKAGVNGTPAQSIVKKGSEAFPPERHIFNTTVARAHLAGTGTEALDLTLLVPVTKPDSPTPLADALVVAWEKIGISAAIIKKTWSKVLPALAAGDYDVALLAWRADSPDLAQNYEALLSCEAIGGGNASRWCDKPFMADLKAVRLAKNPLDRTEALTKAAQKVASDLPLLSLLNLNQPWAVRTEVDGLDARALNARDLSKAVVKVPEPVVELDIDPESGEVAGEDNSG